MPSRRQFLRNGVFAGLSALFAPRMNNEVKQNHRPASSDIQGATFQEHRAFLLRLIPMSHRRVSIPSKMIVRSPTDGTIAFKCPTSTCYSIQRIVTKFGQQPFLSLNATFPRDKILPRRFDYREFPCNMVNFRRILMLFIDTLEENDLIMEAIGYESDNDFHIPELRYQRSTLLTCLDFLPAETLWFMGSDAI